MKIAKITMAEARCLGDAPSVGGGFVMTNMSGLVDLDTDRYPECKVFISGNYILAAVPDSLVQRGSAVEVTPTQARRFAEILDDRAAEISEGTRGVAGWRVQSARLWRLQAQWIREAVERVENERQPSPLPNKNPSICKHSTKGIDENQRKTRIHK